MIATATNFLPLSGGSMNGPVDMGGNAVANPQIQDESGNTYLSVTNNQGIHFANGSGFYPDASTQAQISGDGSGNLTVLYGGSMSFVVGATTFLTLNNKGNIIPKGFHAAKLIFVDGSNGNDNNLGNSYFPYLTLAKALSVATAGTAIFIEPGTYVLAGANSGITPADGVAIIGAGRGVTIIQNHTDYNAVYRPGNNCLLKDITLDTADPTGTHNGISVTLNTSGTTPNNVVFDNVDFICSYDGVNPGGNGAAGGGTGKFSWYFRNCHFHGACWMYYDQTNTGISALFESCDWLGDGSIPRLDGNPQYAAVAAGGNANSQATVVGGNVNFIDPTTNANLMANAAVLTGPGNILFAGANINIVCANAVSTTVVAPWSLLGSAATGGSILIGDGVTFSAYSYFGNSAYKLPPVQYAGGSQSLSVTSSAVTPYFSKQRAEFTISADAGTLTSNTLTINAPANAAGDGSRFTLRIKNTNAGSTAMTLSLNSVYNVGGTSIGSIAAGKRAYLDFCYDGDNSKWDLAGIVSGL